MNITCYIVDDEYHSIDILKAYVERTPGLELLGFSTDPLFALNEVARDGGPMVTFLDVGMPELSGMEFAGMVTLYTRVIFTTSFPEYAIEAFEKEASDYLLKPISYERFLKSVQKVRRNMLKTNNVPPEPKASFFIKSEVKGKMIRVITQEILYVEAAQNYIQIHTEGNTSMAYLTMDEIQRYLPSDVFFRTHRSFIVNKQQITAIEPGQVSLGNVIRVPIGRQYLNVFMEHMQERLLKSKRTN